MKIFYTDVFELPLPPGHRFPMAKYRLLRQRIEESDIRPHCHLIVPRAASNEELMLVHTQDYVTRVVSGQLSQLEQRRIGFPWSEAMVERSRRSVGASIDAGLAALQDGIGVNLAGGTHHAFAESGQGYCVFNDVCVAARVLQRETPVHRVLIVDCDVHQGNGTAAICQHDPSLFSFSMHCDKNFPFRKANSDLDIALPEGTSDAKYLDALERGLASVFRLFTPDICFYVSGADPFSDDRLGRLKLTKRGLAQRDSLVIESMNHYRIPVVVTMAGGYAKQIDDIVEIHFTTVSTALRVTKGLPSH
ncbi:MAG TPA: histone deacetylase [Pirellulaceae bacterium]|nr:histone deacetylase [Pirellulaceae bacterium]HMO90624.1 histone deacetylase [Pirellulaceae bacterium]HMP67797.1 histone deacetylase [Pirellulaceae bacterium]